MKIISLHNPCNNIYLNAKPRAKEQDVDLVGRLVNAVEAMASAMDDKTSCKTLQACGFSV